MFKIKKSLNSIKNKLRLNFYNHPQTYKVNYRVEVFNNSDFKKEFFLVLPIPSNTKYQGILDSVSFFPQIDGKGEDLKYGNKYVFWKMNLKVQESFVVQENFSIKVKPRSKILEKGLKLQDYEDETKNQIYKEKNSFLNLENDDIQDLADEIVRDEDRIDEILQKINNYLIANFKYGDPIPGLYSAKDGLSRKCIDCGGFSSLFVSLCILRGIPARILSGFWAGYKNNTMHAWPEILLPNEKWMPVDPAVEYLYRHEKTLKFGSLDNLDNIGSDRIVFSQGCDIPIILDNKEFRVPILQTPFIYPKEGLEIKVDFLTEKS